MSDEEPDNCIEINGVLPYIYHKKSKLIQDIEKEVEEWTVQGITLTECKKVFEQLRGEGSELKIYPCCCEDKQRNEDVPGRSSKARRDVQLDVPVQREHSRTERADKERPGGV